MTDLAQHVKELPGLEDLETSDSTIIDPKFGNTSYRVVLLDGSIFDVRCTQINHTPSTYWFVRSDTSRPAVNFAAPKAAVACIIDLYAQNHGAVRRRG